MAALKRLRTLLTMVEALERRGVRPRDERRLDGETPAPEQLDMRLWGTSSNYSDGDCGTVACLGGWASLYRPFNEQGLVSATYFHYVEGTRQYDGDGFLKPPPSQRAALSCAPHRLNVIQEDSMSSLQRFFRIKEEDAKHIFGCDNPDDLGGAKIRIREVIDGRV